jgi:hypothetical protein
VEDSEGEELFSALDRPFKDPSLFSNFIAEIGGWGQGEHDEEELTVN